ncbi:hypothetical protein M6D81_14695 [Paenibacillus sp. J5C_2022]|uniref:hypothetical protein n=1 Tax=Paenibacillus sp. J5C2022 TaxID=2977129 RepID=UPI0021D341B1|nr:hypothetical protein [Paenibacillus sp. J5C2022]MCU6709941.1 hypothetical protein [Paenibacillus sp. J5C2022]
MLKNNRVNIVNFIRGVEPRGPVDLIEPVREQIRLVQQNNLAATWLVQYDALIDERFTNLLKEQLNEEQEVGAWFEFSQILVEKIGSTWKGRWQWDWHAHVGLSIGYSPRERELLADAYMAEFYQVFGTYPKSVGSWQIDAHMLGYMADKYGIVASCNCKDQWGTDGYTLWGGYYNQAYYPSRKNSFIPAQQRENQISVPVFRMLGSDPIYQYDVDMNDEHAEQSVITLEPACRAAGGGGGGDPEWVRWFFDVNFNEASLSFGYTQVGQENAFGWELMKEGLTDQIQLLAERQSMGELQVETLAQTGIWYRSNYELTPASSVVARKDWKNEGKQSVWFSNRNYRLNVYWDHDQFWLRDIHFYDESYEERYLTEVCAGPTCLYDALPVLDGARWGEADSKAGIYPICHHSDGSIGQLKGNKPILENLNEEELRISVALDGGGYLVIHCALDKIMVQSDMKGWGLRMNWNEARAIPITEVSDSSIHYVYNHYPYKINCEDGTILIDEQKAGELTIVPERQAIVLCPLGNG